MKKFLFSLCLLLPAPLPAADALPQTPWQAIDPQYFDDPQDIHAPLPEFGSPMITLQQSRYDLRIVGRQALGTITLAGTALVAFPEPVPLFGGEIAVIDVIESDNALLLARDGAYEVYPEQAGMFLLMLTVSIPLLDVDGNPWLGFEIPAAVRNELVLEAPEELRLLETDRLHRVGERYFFAPTRFLDLGFEPRERSVEEIEAADRLLVRGGDSARGRGA